MRATARANQATPEPGLPAHGAAVRARRPLAPPRDPPAAPTTRAAVRPGARAPAAARAPCRSQPPSRPRWRKCSGCSREGVQPPSPPPQRPARGRALESAESLRRGSSRACLVLASYVAEIETQTSSSAAKCDPMQRLGPLAEDVDAAGRHLVAGRGGRAVAGTCDFWVFRRFWLQDNPSLTSQWCAPGRSPWRAKPCQSASFTWIAPCSPCSST